MLPKCAAALIALTLALTGPALGQSAPRIKAKLVAFDGKILTLDDGSGKMLAVGLLDGAHIVQQQKRALSDIKTGDYVGATVIAARDGSRHAEEVHVFPPSLEGAGEGLFAVGAGHFMLDGTVSAVQPGQLTIAYRGAEGGDGPGCTGRAPALGGCKGSAVVTVANGVPVSALVDGDKTLLVSGAVVAVSIIAGPDGKPVTPGLTVEEVPGPAGPATPPAAGH